MGLVDAVMYLVTTITDRGRSLTLMHSVRNAANAETGRSLIKDALSRQVAGLVTDTEVEAIRGRIVAVPSVPKRPTLKSDDLLAALAVFLIVVAATFPVAIPFLIIDDIGLAKAVSRAIALTMLFFRWPRPRSIQGYGSWKTGLIDVGTGSGARGCGYCARRMKAALSGIAVLAVFTATSTQAGEDDHSGRRASLAAKPSWEFGITAYPTLVRGGETTRRRSRSRIADRCIWKRATTTKRSVRAQRLSAGRFPAETPSHGS